MHGNANQGIATKKIKDRDSLLDEKQANEIIGEFLKKDTREKFTTLLSVDDRLALQSTNKGPDELHTKLCSNALSLSKAMTEASWDRMELFKFVARAATTVLSEMHANGWHHRDIKPDNIMICEDPSVAGVYTAKVVDFGVACGDADGIRIICKYSTSGTPVFMTSEYDLDKLISHHTSTYGSTPGLFLTDLKGVDIKTLDQDKFALGLTLADIAGNSPLNYKGGLIIQALLKSLKWSDIKERVQDFDRDDPKYRGETPALVVMGGKANKRKKPTAECKWVSTGRKLALKDGPKVLYKNIKFPGEVRIRKMRKGRDGQIKAAYVKPPTPSARNTGTPNVAYLI